MIYSFAGPRTLAFFRIVIFTIAAGSVLYDHASLLRVFPPEAFHSLGFLQFLPLSFHHFLLQPVALQILSWTSLLVFISSALGLSRRSWLYILAAFLLVLYELIRCSLYSRLPHTRLCLCLLTILCCFFPVSDAWAAARRPKTLRPAEVYRISVRLMLFTITLFYCFIGTSRLLRWPSTAWDEKLMAHLILDGIFTLPAQPDSLGMWTVERPWALWLGVGLFFCFSWVEALAPAALFSRKKNLFWVFAILLMHAGSTYVLRIPFVEQSLLLVLFLAEPFLHQIHLGQKKGETVF